MNIEDWDEEDILQLLQELRDQPSCVPDEELSDEDREFLARKRAQRGH